MAVKETGLPFSLEMTGARKHQKVRPSMAISWRCDTRVLKAASSRAGSAERMSLTTDSTIQSAT